MSSRYNLKIKIQEIAYHRNGIGGEPFYAVRFIATEDGDKPRNMVATVFQRQNAIAVYDIDLLAQGTVAFGENSWRGDNYETEIREALKAQGAWE